MLKGTGHETVLGFQQQWWASDLAVVIAIYHRQKQNILENFNLIEIDVEFLRGSQNFVIFLQLNSRFLRVRVWHLNIRGRLFYYAYTNL